MYLRKGARTYPEANRRVGAEPAARLGSMVRGRPTNFAAQIIEIGGLSLENANFASIKLFFLKNSRNLESAEINT